MSAKFNVSLTFGSRSSVEEVAQGVGQALAVTFEIRESLYLGGDYCRAVSGDDEVIVQHNDDLGEPAEPSHAELPTLVRIETSVHREADIERALRPLGLIVIGRESWG